MMGSLVVEVVWSTDSESSVLRREAIWDLTPEDVVVGMGSFDFAVLCDFKRDGALHAFWEAVGRNTKELCSLSLRAWSNEIDVDWTGRISLGGEDGLMPANHWHENAVKQSFWIPSESA